MVDLEARQMLIAQAILSCTPSQLSQAGLAILFLENPALCLMKTAALKELPSQ